MSPSVTQEIDVTFASYEEMAPYYDAVTEVPDYARWTTMFDGLVTQHGAPGRRLLDLGCGTGKSALEFHILGYRVTGMDLSPAMIEVARAKRGGPGIDFQVGDLRDLPEAGPFDVATCIGEPLNYLHNDEELCTAFRGVRRMLAPSGLFVFELNTVRAFAMAAAGVSVRESDDAFVVVRPDNPEPFAAGGRSSVVFDCFVPRLGAGWRRSTTRHNQRHFPDSTARRVLRYSGLDLLAVHGIRRGQLQDTLHEDEDLKAFYVARRPPASR
jgi:SAM-dependent methyltransferase